MRSTNRWLLVVPLVVAGLAMAAVAGGAKPKPKGPILNQYKFKGATFTVGSKKFTEQLILGQITKLALQATGAKVNDQTDLGGTALVRSALVSGRIDMYWEYTGTGWITHLNNTKPVAGSKKQFAAVAKADRANDIVWLTPAPFDNTYAFAVRKEAVSKLGVRKISDFKTLIRKNPKQATMCVNNEFATRDDGLPGVEKRYGFRFPPNNVPKIEQGIIYTAIDEGKLCNFGVVFATDGRIQGLGLYVIKDDKEFFPVYNPALNVRASVYKKYPKLGAMFKRIALKLTTARMTKMNADVDMRGKFPEEVARAFLKQYKFIK